MPDEKYPSDPFEMFRRLWGPLGLPVPGMAMPTLDPQEIEQRIADLRSVEGWLSMNLNMVRLSIQGLEVQKSALLAMRAAAGPGSSPAGGQASGAAAAAGTGDPAAAWLWPWLAAHRAMTANASAPQGSGEAPARDEGIEK
jgi:hypothetical protein